MLWGAREPAFWDKPIEHEGTSNAWSFVPWDIAFDWDTDRDLAPCSRGPASPYGRRAAGR
jgi:hypothetical protein